MQLQKPAKPSSQIAALAHDPETDTLAIQFHPTLKEMEAAAKEHKAAEGSIYHYSNVDADAFKALNEADSIGSHFIHQIKKQPDKHPFRRIG